MSDSENTVKGESPIPTTDLVENNSNKYVLKCKFCASKILDKKSAKYVVQEVQLPLMLQDSRKEGEVQNETMNEFYHVESMYTFENIGFTHTVNNYKYLSCADCDAGPVGYFDMSTNQSYVAVSRVEHA
ncbi:guanine nucleotide exchange factor MSS4 homolog [Aricia agestis]|uniref:guanine nucleotide exchange factor MSS4 homolog n=1 Tax=Aricia agestis TaxID=91739 RepID=UPI001C2029B4|nr:guanine nucleotide exchange factor MSS4 homolog [Aricia agestis]